MTSTLGMFLFVVGGVASGVCLLPSRGVREWAYESWWLVYAVLGLLVCPPVLCAIFVPDFRTVIASAPLPVIVRCVGFGMMWGVGALSWGLMVRYLGFGLGLAIGCGLCAALGTLIPPIAQGQAALLVKDAGALLVLAGVVGAVVGVVLVGLAGVSKESEMSEEDKRKAIPEANFRKGVFFALVAGVFSAGMNFGLQGGRALEEAAQAAGTAPQWCGLPVVLLVLWGGFAVEASWCLWRNARNGTFGDYRRIVPLNYLCCAAIGGLWVVQFVCQKAGEPMMGDLRYVSFAVVMASTILGSTVAGLALGEWRGTGVRTRALLGLGMAVMLAGFVAMSLGSR